MTVPEKGKSRVYWNSLSFDDERGLLYVIGRIRQDSSLRVAVVDLANYGVSDLDFSWLIDRFRGMNRGRRPVLLTTTGQTLRVVDLAKSEIVQRFELARVPDLQIYETGSSSFILLDSKGMVQSACHVRADLSLFVREFEEPVRHAYLADDGQSVIVLADRNVARWENERSSVNREISMRQTERLSAVEFFDDGVILVASSLAGGLTRLIRVSISSPPEILEVPGWVVDCARLQSEHRSVATVVNDSKLWFLAVNDDQIRPGGSFCMTPSKFAEPHFLKKAIDDSAIMILGSDLRVEANWSPWNALNGSISVSAAGQTGFQLSSDCRKTVIFRSNALPQTSVYDAVVLKGGNLVAVLFANGDIGLVRK